MRIRIAALVILLTLPTHNSPLKQLRLTSASYARSSCESYLSQLEKGAFYASLKIVSKLAAVLDVEPAELLKSPLKRSGKYR